MKLAFVLENYFPNVGGVETLFKNLIDSLAQEGHQIHIVTSRITPDAPLKEKNGNIQITRMPFNNRYLFTFLGFFYAIRAIRSCDLVHTTSYNAAIPAFLVGKLFQKKIIITFHEVWADLWWELPYMGKIAKGIHYLFEQILLKLPFHHFIGVSKSTTANLAKAGLDPKKLSTIYNGITYEAFLGTSPVKDYKKKSFTFTYFGRLGISKGLDLILEALPSMQKKLPDCQLKLIIPKTPDAFLQTIIRQIKQYELENFVTIKHHLSFDALKNEIISSDCILIPSYSEGFCFAAVETMALGVPIISSNQTALKEVISGKFIKMDELSSKGLLNAMEKAQRAEWEKSPLKKFPLKHTIMKYKNLYENILA